MSQTKTSRNRTIFLAEDDIDDQEFLGEALLSLNPAVELKSFTSGIKFIEALEKTPDNLLPCLIILDYNIPEINGAEILGHLRLTNRYNHIHKIVWSTSNSDYFKKNCLDLGAKDYVIKPSNVTGLREIAEFFLSICER